MKLVTKKIMICKSNLWKRLIDKGTKIINEEAQDEQKQRKKIDNKVSNNNLYLQ